MKSAEPLAGRRRSGLALTVTTALCATLIGAPAGAEVIDEGFAAVLYFEGYTAGGLDGQDGWTVVDEAVVVVDPVDPENQILEMTGPGLSAHRAVTPIENGDTGTVFFRIRRDANVDTSFGITDNDNLSDYPHSRGGPYEEITRLPQGAEEVFDFRENVTGALDRFF